MYDLYHLISVQTDNFENFFYLNPEKHVKLTCASIWYKHIFMYTYVIKSKKKILFVLKDLKCKYSYTQLNAKTNYLCIKDIKCFNATNM